MSRYIASIDQGTTSTRCILFDRDGIVAAAQAEHRQIFPRPGWVEHDPVEIWRRTAEVIREAMRSAGAGGASGGDIAAVGITNQRETTVVWNRRTGEPYGNAIVWQDTRTKEICDTLANEAGSDGGGGGDGGVGDGACGGGRGQDRFRNITGLPLATYFAGPKVRWMLDHVDGLRAAADKGDAIFGTIDSWLIWNLTGGVRGGVHVTDVTNASRTMLMNLETLDWDDRMLRMFGIPRAMLPCIMPSSVCGEGAGGYGMTTSDGPFGASVPICGVLGDQHAALVGQACFAPGESKNTYGTGCFMLLNTGQKIVQSWSGLLTTVGYKFGDAPAVYALEGSIAVTGSLVQWLRDNLGLIAKSPDVETLAATVPDNGGVYFVPAFSGLFAPYWRSDARGCLVGMTRFTNRGHIARAALEATAFQTRDVTDAMATDSGVPVTALKVDGGMSVNELLMQFQADVLGVPVVRPRITETTALGAAYAAGLAAGYWSGLDELRKSWVEDKRWTPRMSAAQRDALHATWRKAVERSLGWAE